MLYPAAQNNSPRQRVYICLLYTSDAADDGESVDLGGRRIIKKNFFKQKTAYEIMPSLVGSEMCIRDSPVRALPGPGGALPRPAPAGAAGGVPLLQYGRPVSYTHLTLPTTERV